MADNSTTTNAQATVVEDAKLIEAVETAVKKAGLNDLIEKLASFIKANWAKMQNDKELLHRVIKLGIVIIATALAAILTGWLASLFMLIFATLVALFGQKLVSKFSK